MSKYKVFHPDHERIGASIINLLDAINSKNFADLVREFHLDNINPEQWYPEQNVLDFLEAVTERDNAMFNLVSIGMAQAAHAKVPDEYYQISIKQLYKLNEEYAQQGWHMNFRGTDTGCNTVRLLSDTKVRLDYRVPHPADFWYGTAYGWMKRFASPKGLKFKVYFDPSQAHPKASDAGNPFTVFAEWDAE